MLGGEQTGPDITSSESMKISFPGIAGSMPAGRLSRYYDIYYKYVLNVFRAAGAEVNLVGDTAVSDARFKISVDGVDAVIDYSDHLGVIPGYSNYFKFHCSIGVHDISSIHPFPPVSFYDWGQYNKLANDIEYHPTSKGLILSIQRPYGNAITRRINLQNAIKSAYPGCADTTVVDQIQYWRKINRCLVHVFAPGCRNDMLDRGQIQYLAFGCCTISPRIITMLPFNTELVPGVHYLQCKDDYSDVLSCIEWCRTHTGQCKQIGANAKRLFMDTCIPPKILKWMSQEMGKS